MVIDFDRHALALDYSLLVEIFGSKLKADEIVYLFAGIKEVVRHGFYPHEQKRVNLFCLEQGLFVSWSDFLVVIDEFDAQSGFSNKGIRVSLSEGGEMGDGLKGMRFAYISFDEKSSLLAQLYEKQLDHKALGKLLGYPVCCQDYFLSSFSENSPNPELQGDLGYLDLSKRHLDLCLLSHFPCSFECEISLKIAKERLEVLEAFFSDRALELYKGLS